MTPKAPASPWGCRSLLLTRQTYHVLPSEPDGLGFAVCYCGSVVAHLESMRCVPLSGLLVQQ